LPNGVQRPDRSSGANRWPAARASPAYRNPAMPPPADDFRTNLLIDQDKAILLMKA
jgi:hypothetical protein